MCFLPSPPSLPPSQNLSKSKEQLNGTEERLKQAAVDLQKLQMDLMAKRGECAGLEEQVRGRWWWRGGRWT